MLLLPLLAQIVAAPVMVVDTVTFPPNASVIRLYTDCDEDRWPFDTAEVLVPKTPEELRAGIARRRELEARWRRWFAAHAGDSIAPTPVEQWVYPLAVRGRLLDNFNNPRPGGPHAALDIFVTREGAEVRSPVAGVVVAAGDGWIGGWDRRRRDLWYEGGGLSRRAGNGVIIFDPVGASYHYLIHLQEGVPIRAGHVVRAGQRLGRVGHSGNAAGPGRGKHLHYAYKQPGSACGQDGVLVSVNPYRWVRAARGRMDAAH